ncbi:hypothetical protein [Chryseobacterium gambrini]|uniref:hypothetical protein n=1 Tax=Chryseobacterium gambrini TaxID=373672 RepID=UPI0022F16E60|nr:hypothetical protein [Chryseobacterium gambrini]WBV52074.1 hypothetical protein PFY09_17355 [Chryseobacterium gambrini]
MEINSAIVIGIIIASYMFLFCVIPYYINKFLLKEDIKAISMLIHFGKPLYSYPLKNGIKINFGYLPGSSIEFKDAEGLDDKEQIKYAQRRSNIINVIYHGILVFVLFSVALIFGHNPVKICREILVIAYELLTKKIDYNQLIPIISKNFQMYGRVFFLCFVVLLLMIISLLLNLTSSLWKYLGFISLGILIVLYFVYDLTFFMFPLSFYIDILLAMTISQFIYFFLLRFFIK